MSRKHANLFSGADITRKIAMILIVFAMGVVVVFAVYKAINTPEKVTKDRISAYARAYYEDYFYPKVKSSVSGDNFETVMRQYAEEGIDNGRVSLRQLMLHNGGKFSNELDAISDYCELDNTYVEIFPQKPYNKSDYRVNYKYSCKF
jgi:hypothetical protein